MVVYLNGRFVDSDEALVPVTDRSFLYGDGCFEGIGVCEGRILHLEDHARRLLRSARMLRLNCPVDAAGLQALMLETASRNGMDRSAAGYLRPVLSRGTSAIGVRNIDLAAPAALYIIPQVGDVRMSYRGEIKLQTAAFSTFQHGGLLSIDPRIKANNYLHSILAVLEARDRGADVAILRNREGWVTETYGTNIFCVTDGVVRTPPEREILAGITRKHVIETARALGVPCREDELTRYDLINADEVFVTSSLDGIAAVSAIDGLAFDIAAPGPVTRRLREAYVEAAIAAGDRVPVFAGTES